MFKLTFVNKSAHGIAIKLYSEWFHNKNCVWLAEEGTTGLSFVPYVPKKSV